MNTGLGFSEILLICTLILVFFGSKELPAFIREAAKLLAKVRRYSERLKSELNEISRAVEEPIKNISSTADVIKSVAERKSDLRKQFIDIRKNIDPDQHGTMSEFICKTVMDTKEYEKATAVMVYVSTGREVATRKLIEAALSSGKRVVVPYCLNTTELGIAEIRDFEKDLAPGALGVPEPVESLRTHFFRSDIKLVICPGVAFDMNGGRLGRGKAYYDNFLREFKGKIPLFGLAFNCQILNESLPFDYHDVAMDQIVTEKGLLLNNLTTVSSNEDIKQIPAG